MCTDTVASVVFEALDNAVENGCQDELAGMSATEVAYDLARFSAGCERLPIPWLTAAVLAWRVARGTVAVG